MDKKLAKNIFFSVICSLLLLSSVLGAVFGFMPKKDTTTAFNSTYTETDNAVVVGEIWGGSTFNVDTTAQFFRMLGNGQYSNIEALSSAVGSGAINATTLRGYSAAGNTAGKSIVVTLGGFKWIVTYLTKDSDGNLIATLWMADANGTSTYGNSSGYGANSFTSGYPSSMYGTSYVAVATLNNGGSYANITSNSSNATSLTSYTSSSTHQYAAFTNSSGGIRPYIVQPNKVPYQTSSQGTSYQGTGCALMNESLATNVTGYFYSYQTLTGYTNWGDDYLWLPSISETGANSSSLGMWQTSQAERANLSDTYSWLRSGTGSYSNHVICLSSIGGYASYSVSDSHAIRPALHLNLSKVAQAVSNTIGIYITNNSLGEYAGSQNGYGDSVSYGSAYPADKDRIIVQFYNASGTFVWAETLSFLSEDSIWTGAELITNKTYTIKVIAPTFLKYTMQLSIYSGSLLFSGSTISFQNTGEIVLDIIVSSIRDDSWLTDFNALS